MSTIKVNKIENTSTINGGVSIDNDGHVTIDGQQLPTAGPLSNRNLIINGAMRVSQRSTSNTGQTAGAYRACDRFKVDIGTLGTWTISQSTNAPAGFVNSLRIECTTADASPAANDYIAVFYNVEAQDVSWINYGTADAKPLMLSFYVRSNKTGSASFEVTQPDNSFKLFSKVYSFNGTADVWKKVEIPISADTAGLIANDNGAGLRLGWWLNSGSNFTSGGSITGWEALDDTKRNPTNAGIGGAVSDYFEITGVQLEVGTKSTPFEHRSYGDELQRCMRYYQKTNNTPVFNSTPTGSGASAIPLWFSGDINAHTRWYLPVRMRAPASASFIGNPSAGTALQGTHVTGDDGTIGVYYNGAWQSSDSWTFAATETTENSVRMNCSGLPRGATGNAGGLYFYGSASTATVTLDAEL